MLPARANLQQRDPIPGPVRLHPSLQALQLAQIELSGSPNPTQHRLLSLPTCLYSILPRVAQSQLYLPPGQYPPAIHSLCGHPSQPDLPPGVRILHPAGTGETVQGGSDAGDLGHGAGECECHQGRQKCVQEYSGAGLDYPRL